MRAPGAVRLLATLCAALFSLLPSDRVFSETRGAVECSPSTSGVLALRSHIAAIVIDPGHGGSDPGASATVEVDGRRVGLLEKKIVLAVARELEQKLRRRYPKKRIVKTRSSDRYLSLEERASRANAVPLAGGETLLFLSLHANSSLDRQARGAEAWYLPGSYERAVIERRDLDGEAQGLYAVLNAMRREEYATESALLGGEILSAIAEVTGQAGRGLKRGELRVVRRVNMPAVLIEVGFLSNPSEARLFDDPVYLGKLAQGIYTGVSNFVTFFENCSDSME